MSRMECWPGSFLAFGIIWIKTCRRWFNDYWLNNSMFIETNPVPVKTALALMGKISDELRAPLAHMSEDHVEQLKTVLKRYALI